MLPDAGSAKGNGIRYRRREPPPVFRGPFDSQVGRGRYSSGLQRGDLRRSTRSRGHRDRLLRFSHQQLQARRIHSRRNQNGSRRRAPFSCIRAILQWIRLDPRGAAAHPEAGWHRCLDRRASGRPEVHQAEEGFFG